MNTARGAIMDTLLTLASTDPRIMTLATDSRGSAMLTAFTEALPDQFVECGIAEQDAIGIAAGLANAGYLPFVCGPACFYSLRAAEQIKVDVAYSRMNVKIIGVSGGVSYGALGSTHHATQDIALTRAIPGLDVILPADATSAAALIRLLAASDRPAYVRVGRGAVPDVYGQTGIAGVSDGETHFEIGRATRLREGGDAAVFACGETVYHAVVAADRLRESGVKIGVWDMHTIKPLDEQAIIEGARTGAVLTVEEHSGCGGLGEAVAGVLCRKQPCRMRLLSLPDEPLVSGSGAQLFAHYGLDAVGIERAIAELLR